MENRKTVFKATYTNVEELEIVRESEKSYWFEGDSSPYRKDGTMDYSFFGSFEAAKAYLIEKHDRAVAGARNSLEYREEQYRKVMALGGVVEPVEPVEEVESTTLEEIMGCMAATMPNEKENQTITNAKKQVVEMEARLNEYVEAFEENKEVYGYSEEQAAKANNRILTGDAAFLYICSIETGDVIGVGADGVTVVERTASPYVFTFDQAKEIQKEVNITNGRGEKQAIKAEYYGDYYERKILSLRTSINSQNAMIESMEDVLN